MAHSTVFRSVLFTLSVATCVTTARGQDTDEAKPFRLEEVHHFDKGGTVYSIAVSGDGKRALIGGDMGDRSMLVWDVAKREPIRRIQKSGILVGMRADGELAAMAGLGAEVILLDMSDGRDVGRMRHSPFLSAIAYSPTGRHVASSGLDAAVRVFDVEQRKEIRKFSGHEAGVRDLAFSPDGNILVSVSEDKTLRSWQIDTGENLHTLMHDDPVWSVSISPDGSRYLTGCGGPMFGSPTELNVVELETNPMILWNAETGERIRTMTGHNHAVRGLSISPDGSLAASGSLDGTLRLWELDTGKQLARHDGESWVTTVHFLPDGEHLLCGGGAFKEDLEWKVRPNERVRTFRIVRAGDDAP